MWDEPGFTCTYGTLPFSPFIRTAYQRKQGKVIERDLWKLALEARDGSHIPVRVAYYGAIQRLLNSANACPLRSAIAANRRPPSKRP